jgi:16S rRNA (uracil1498-N3)-methyltransferase
MKSKEHHLFFASRIENNVAYLDIEESRHAMSVLRFSSGDTLMVTDGRGTIYECRITSGAPDAQSVTVMSTTSAQRPRCAVRMFVGMCDRDKFEELCENCAALGADLIVPLVCRFSQKAWWNAWDKHADRIHKKLVAGIKQSRNPWLPVCAQPTAFSDAFSKAEASLIIAADENGGQVVEVLDRIKQAAAVSCFIGPPGGFSPDELSALKNADAAFVSLSANRLRTELAAVVLCGAVTMMTSV